MNFKEAKNWVYRLTIIIDEVEKQPIDCSSYDQAKFLYALEFKNLPKNKVDYKCFRFKPNGRKTEKSRYMIFTDKDADGYKSFSRQFGNL